MCIFYINLKEYKQLVFFFSWFVAILAFLLRVDLFLICFLFIFSFIHSAFTMYQALSFSETNLSSISAWLGQGRAREEMTGVWTKELTPEMQKKEKKTYLRHIWKEYSVGLNRLGGRVGRFSGGRNLEIHLDTCLKRLKNECWYPEIKKKKEI